MENERKGLPEYVRYGLIFLGALLLRLLLLGRTTLVESEAGWAVQAWLLSGGEHVTLGSQVGYLAVSRALFTLFGSSNFLARFWPAVVGSLVVWIPYCLRKDIGSMTGLVMGVGLALDPALVTVSRVAGGPIPALVFLALGLVSLHHSKIPWAVFFTGLGLLSGPDFWLGLLVGLIWLVAVRALGFLAPVDYVRSRLETYQRSSGQTLTDLLIPFLLLAFFASIFLTDLQGLSAWVGAFPEFLASWLQPNGIPWSKLTVTVLISNPLALFFGVLGIVSWWRSGNQKGKLIAIWIAVAYLVLSIYPSRQAEDLIWIALPLWWSAGAELVRIYRSSKWSWVSYVLAGLAAVLLALNWLTFIGSVFQMGNNRALLLGLGLLAASIALIVLSMTIVTTEWGGAVAWQGLAAGAALMLALYMVSSLTMDAYRWDKDPRSLYAVGPGPGQMGLLRDSITSASLTVDGRPETIKGLVVEDDDSLRWALRGFPDIQFTETLDPGDPPLLVITSQSDISQVDQDQYRGQDFVLNVWPGWAGSIPDDWISWIAFRFGPIEPEHVILWIRNDIDSGY